MKKSTAVTTSKRTNVKLVQKYKFNKFAAADAIMSLPLTANEQELVDKYF